MSITATVAHCLDQIERHNATLKAVVSTLPRDDALRLASHMDQEVASGNGKGLLHGVPILIKDTICTPSTGLPTTCGSFALKDAVARRDASIVRRLVSSGALILGKTNITAFGKASKAGWSAIGGQTHSPFISSDAPAATRFQDHDSPSGSSSGSAVGVAASFAPVAIALETEESTVSPSGRAGIFGLKMTHGSVPMDGIQPYSPDLDCVGVMAQKAHDILPILTCLRGLSYDAVARTASLEPTFKGLKIGVVDSALWQAPQDKITPNEVFNQVVRDATVGAIAKLRGQGAMVFENVVVSSYDDITNGFVNIDQIICRDFAQAQEQFLGTFRRETIGISNLDEWINYNRINKMHELPPDHPSQAGLEALLMPSGEATDTLVAETRGRAAEAIEAALGNYGEQLHVILGPADSRLAAVASLAGYPIACMPLGQWTTGLDHNGRCFGIYALSKSGIFGETNLLEVMMAWERVVRDFRGPRQFS